VRNHPFVDGNERAGILAAHVFLTMNGQMFRPLEGDIVTRLVATAASQVTEADLAVWLRSASRPEA
jgi:death-on-curing protein